VQNALQQLVKIGKLERFFYGKGKVKYGYCLPTLLKKETPLQVAEPVQTSVTAVEEIENLKISLNQETGALTVKYRNLNIEIQVMGK